MNISIVIPANNEEKNIRFILQNLKEILEHDSEVIVVNDYSCDYTNIIARQMLKDYPQLRLINNPYKKGFANALRAGISNARKGVIIPVMADCCDEIKIIPQMYAMILEECDVVCASRYIKGGKREGGHILKALFSQFGSWLIHKINKIPATDLTNSFKAYRKRVLEDIDIKSKGFEISMEIVLKAYLKGYKIAELPTRWKERTRGRSKFFIFKDGIQYIKWFVFGLFIPVLFKFNNNYGSRPSRGAWKA